MPMTIIGSMLLMIVIGIVRTALGNPPHVGEIHNLIQSNGQTLTVFLLARAFADGCSAMTGTMVASPAYIFIGSMLLMIVIGIVRTALGNPPHVGEIHNLIQSNGQTQIGRAHV